MMDLKEISQYLPHRYPFLLVDRVVGLTPGETITGFKNLTANEQFFNGHFPGNPVMPGVLIVEALAQLSGILVLKSKQRTLADGEIFFLGGIDNVRFRRPVVPGDRLDMTVRLLASKRGVAKFDAQAHVEGTLACSAEITCVEKRG